MLFVLSNRREADVEFVLGILGAILLFLLIVYLVKRL
jgi:flagellar biogenesis protein FliO